MNLRLPSRLGFFSILGAQLALPVIAHAAEDPATLDRVVVTGTREDGRKARTSATPIDVLSAADLAATGQTNLLDALRNVLPSLGTPAVGYDVGALARTFQLRGLSPAHTLVLVNGKRRHASASIYADSDPAQGANAVDLDLIPLAAVERVEVLRDGAAAQYGSDAIAGVVNVILKSDVAGGSLSVLGGGYSRGGGRSAQVDLDHGFALGSGGRLHLSLGWRDHDFSNRSADSGGPQPARVQGDPKNSLLTGAFNLEQPLSGDLAAYAFGSLARREAKAWENPRQPGWFSDAIDALYPNGFTPQETSKETDLGLTGGLKGRIGDGWRWDLGATYGRDQVKLRNVNTINPDLLADTGNKQTDFNVGAFTSSDLTVNLDLRRSVKVDGLVAPLNLALGLESRHETFRIDAGEPGAYYLGGSQAFPGFRPSDGADVRRSDSAAYVDVALRPLSVWELGFAGRVENAQGVGSKAAGKLSSRYDVSAQFGLRGSLSNGFHAPTLAQQHYSATTVTTGYAQIQLPLGSAGAKVLGAPDLKPETSRNLSLGLVAEPVKGLHATLDAYRIDITDRIIQSASLAGPLALAAITANGSSIPPDVSSGNASAAFFTNGVDTRTQGIDLTLDQRMDLGVIGQLKWQLAAGYNKTSLRRVHEAPASLAAAGLTLVDGVQRSNLTSATPHTKVSLAATLRRDAFEIMLRETFYSSTLQVQGYAPGPYYEIRTGAAVITDLDLGWTVNERVKLSLGANNLFNRTPNELPLAVSQSLSYDKYSHVSPYGINGAAWYARVGVLF
jgi:iron complex outermembrane receptor protein